MHAVSSEFILSYCSYHIIIFILSYHIFTLLACSSEPAFSQKLTALLYVTSLLCCVVLKQSHAVITPAWSVTPKDEFWMSPFRGFPGTSKLEETPGQTQSPLKDLENVAERTDRRLPLWPGLRSAYKNGSIGGRMEEFTLIFTTVVLQRNFSCILNCSCPGRPLQGELWKW